MASEVFRAGSQGMRGEILLLFALLVWLIFFIIYRSSPRNRMNRWCFASGLIFGTGVMKEYLYYELGPELIANGIWSAEFSQLLYSLLSAVFYYLSMPPALIFCLCFCHLDRKRPRLFRGLCAVAFIPALLFALRYPCRDTLAFQKDPVFCLSVAVYEWCYGLICILLLIHTLWKERMSGYFRERFMAASALLIPLICWLVAAFPYHVFGGLSFSKLWQINVVVVAAVLVYLMYHLFHGGIWGIRFHWERYDWEEEVSVVQKNAGYVAHALKNELAKMEWSLDSLRQQGVSAWELDIIRSSASYLKRFLYETQIYSDKISLHLEECDVSGLLEEAIQEFEQRRQRHAHISVSACDRKPLLCDKIHLREVLRNLLDNAAEAAGEDGEIHLSYRYQKGFWGGKACIQVKDNGIGIARADRKRIFEPYYTTKGTNRNMGLGLFYCWNVMHAHKGRIEAESRKGQGSVFTLWFPERGGAAGTRWKRKRRDRNDGKNEHTDRRG